MRVFVSKEERKRDVITGTEEGTDVRQQGRKKDGNRDVVTGMEEGPEEGGHQQGRKKEGCDNRH